MHPTRDTLPVMYLPGAGGRVMPALGACRLFKEDRFMSSVTLRIAIKLLAFSVAATAAPSFLQRNVAIPTSLAHQLVADINKGDDGPLSKEEADALLAGLYVTLRDIDSDGVEEFFLQGDNARWCGTGGCISWLYRQSGNGYQLLLEDKNLDAADEVTNGYCDVLSRHPAGACCLTTIRYKFDGKRYRKTEVCYQETDARNHTEIECKKRAK